MKGCWVLRLDNGKYRTNEKYKTIKEWWIPIGATVEVIIRSEGVEKTAFIEVIEDAEEG